MKAYMMSQVFTLIVAAFLTLVFYTMLAAGMVSGQNFITDLILIIIAITLLAMFSTIAKIEYHLKGGRKRK